MPTDEQAIAFLEDILRLYSPSTQELAVAERIAQQMAVWGAEAEIDAAGNPVGHWGSGERQVVLLGHIDTVPGEIIVRRDGDLIYGRGAVDAKGPMAAFVVAAARARALPNLRVTVIGAVEEEAASSKGAYYAVDRCRPAFAVIGEPSGWDRVTLGYKGRLLVDYVLQRAMSHTAGSAKSACEQAVTFWREVEAFAERFNADKEGRFDTLDPSLRAINTSSDGLSERVEMHIGLRLPLGLDIEVLRAALEGWRGEAQVATRAHELPFRADKRNDLTSAFLTAIRAEGGKAAFVTKTGTSDMNVLGPRWGCPIVAYGPGDSSLDHTPDEHIAISEYLAAIRVLMRTIERLGSI